MLQAVATSIPAAISDNLPWPFFVLQYADDTLIFSTAKERAPAILQLTLKVFSAVSGLCVNPAKSSIVPFNMTEEMVDGVLQTFSCSAATLPITYLGLPLSHTKPSKEWFQTFINRVESRLPGWKGAFLSRAGRILLTDAVLSTIHVYAMSVFKFPAWVVREIDKIRKKFIWNTSGNQGRGMHLVAWQRVCLPKEVGGMGLHDLKLHNVAMLLRWWWILYHKRDSQWTIVATRLFAKHNCCVPPLLWNRKGSFFWRDLQSLSVLFQLSAVRVIGDGTHTSFWFDNWGGRPLRFMQSERDKPQKPFISLRRGLQQINSLLPMPRDCFDTNILQEVPNLASLGCPDGLKWRWAKDGCFSVASTYKAFIRGGKVLSPCKRIWKLRVTPTLRLFLYLLASDKLLTQYQLSRRGVVISPKCVLCGDVLIETAQHLFFQCRYARDFWALLCSGSGRRPVFLTSVQHSVLTALSVNTPDVRNLVSVATGLWMLWLERNNRVFRSAERTAQDLVERVRSQVTAFLYTF